MADKTLKSRISIRQREAAEAEILRQSKTVRYDTKDFTIGYLVSEFNPKKESTEEEYATNKLFLIPEYQRNSIWTPADKSLFIESILLGLPIPFLFFCERDDGMTEIVDGVQRITTLYSFINNEIRLSKLQKLSLLNGFRYSDLSDYIFRSSGQAQNVNCEAQKESIGSRRRIVWR